MATLRLLQGERGTEGHAGEVFACAFVPDGSGVLSGGWDGKLRLWDARTGRPVAELQASAKPVSACAPSPDSLTWLCGSLDGCLSCWDSGTHQLKWRMVAHSRPVSAIVWGAEPGSVITASWDRTLTVWPLGRERDRVVLGGHEDIVCGCRFMADGQRLLSWSHDGSLRLWDVNPPQQQAAIPAHQGRITAAAVSPDGCWAASASRDGHLKLWDLRQQQEAASLGIDTEIRACLFLLDGEWLVTVGADGVLTRRALPTLEPCEELATHVGVQCAELSPSGSQVALGADDGRVWLVEVEGFDEGGLLVTPIQTQQRTATGLQRLLGGSTLTRRYSCTCPVCRQSFEVAVAAPGQSAGCPLCRRRLRFSTAVRVAPQKERQGSGPCKA